ncbi:FecR domain-containing protein [Paraburkholderia sp.]|uniref:FecR domain-containing protein n=1 Tax=Paraburkholderia sp. TaxID=1926495 RepID=UPI0039E62B81
MTPRPSHATLQAAAEWYAVLRSGDATPGEKADWQSWLDASSEHRTAWRYIEQISKSFAALQDMPDPMRASESLVEANARVHRRRRALLGIAGLLGVGGLTGLIWRQSPGTLLAWAADYRTGTGEQRDVFLPDGTHVWINTATAFNLAFDGAIREVKLVRGEVFIETAHDATRPFVVSTSEGRLHALGTRFNVLQGDDATLLSVYEGAVEVTLRDSDQRTMVPAGHQIRFTRDRIGWAQEADPAREAWTRGVLIARDITLGEFVEQLQRYRSGHLGVAGEVAGLRVYGSFPLRDTDRAIAMLATVLPVRAHETLPWWVTIVGNQ